MYWYCVRGWAPKDSLSKETMALGLRKGKLYVFSLNWSQRYDSWIGGPFNDSVLTMPFYILIGSETMHRSTFLEALNLKIGVIIPKKLVFMYATNVLSESHS